MHALLRRAGALLLGLALALAPALAAAQPGARLVPVPPMQALVTDLTGTLTPAQQATLESRLRAFSDRKGAQVAVLVVPTTGAESIEAYGLRVVEQWKPGRRKADDGVLLLVAKDDRALRIEVGYGLEGAVPDAVAKRIVSEVIAPRFREGDWFGGLDAGTDRLLRLIDGEPLPPVAARDAPAPDAGRLMPVFIVVALALGGVLRAALGRLPGAAVTGVAVGGLAWFISGTLAVAAIGALVAFFSTLLGAGAGGALRGFGAGRGGSGGGFGGGGGGRFGGGGASGRW
jgi:uncharacterized protein